MSEKDDKFALYQKVLKEQLAEGMVKVRVKNAYEGMSETLWCEPVDKNLLKVCNIPFFTEKLCLDDIIEAEVQEGDAEWFFTYLRTVEHVTQSVHVAYITEGLDQEEIIQRHHVFTNLCSEHGLKCECPRLGFLVVAVPYGKIDEKLPLLADNAKTAKLEVMIQS